jgi:hypothetical protein
LTNNNSFCSCKHRQMNDSVGISAPTSTRPSWITDEDEAFVRSACVDFVHFDAARELSQSSIAIVRRKAPARPLFFKKSCVVLLQAKSPRNPEAKWRVTQRSFVNEHRFLEDTLVLETLKDIRRSSTPSQDCLTNEKFLRKQMLRYLKRWL